MYVCAASRRVRSIVYQSYLPPVLLSRFANCLVSRNEREEGGVVPFAKQGNRESARKETVRVETTALNTVFALHAPRQKYLCAWFRADPRRASDTSLATTFLSSSDRRRETCRRWANTRRKRAYCVANETRTNCSTDIPLVYLRLVFVLGDRFFFYRALSRCPALCFSSFPQRPFVVVSTNR